jgi:chromosome partitioning protein
MTDVDVQDHPVKARKRKSSITAGATPQEISQVMETTQPLTRPLRVILSSPKGGSGKTGTCRNLAVAAVLDGFKVATVDFDPQKTLTNWWQKRPTQAADIEHFAANITDVDAVLNTVTDFDIVFFDTAPSVEDHLDEMKKLLVPADLVIVPTKQSEDDLDSVLPWMAVLRRFQPKSCFLLNAVKPKTKIFQLARNRIVKTGHPVCPVEIPDYVDFEEAARIGISVLELRQAKGREQVEGVWNFVRAHLGIVAS